MIRAEAARRFGGHTASGEQVFVSWVKGGFRSSFVLPRSRGRGLKRGPNERHRHLLDTTANTTAPNTAPNGPDRRHRNARGGPEGAVPCLLRMSAHFPLAACRCFTSWAPSSAAPIAPPLLVSTQPPVWRGPCASAVSPTETSVEGGFKARWLQRKSTMMPRWDGGRPMWVAHHLLLRCFADRSEGTE